MFQTYFKSFQYLLLIIFIIQICVTLLLFIRLKRMIMFYNIFVLGLKVNLLTYLCKLILIASLAKYVSKFFSDFKFPINFYFLSPTIY